MHYAPVFFFFFFFFTAYVAKYIVFQTCLDLSAISMLKFQIWMLRGMTEEKCGGSLCGFVLLCNPVT